MPSPAHFKSMLRIYGYASQAFWRSFEVDVLSRVQLEHPILEIGCSDGEFTRAVCGTVELGIDINPNAVERALRSRVFKEVRLQNARELDHAGFRTVIANSVLEHIPDVQPVLDGSFKALLSGGKLVLTVPLVDMNRGMLFSSRSWLRFRHGRLSHVNLWSLDHWMESLHKAGFHITHTERYLSPSQIRTWDAMDGVAVMGTRRINLGSISMKVTRSLPGLLQGAFYAICGRLLARHLVGGSVDDGCCALIVATKA